ncbi:unnamed protein product, partial [Phytomonas sp. EM1]
MSGNGAGGEGQGQQPWRSSFATRGRDPARPPAPARAQRPITDGPLEALAGVIHQALSPTAEEEVPTNEGTPVLGSSGSVIDRIARILVNPSCGLLQYRKSSGDEACPQNREKRQGNGCKESSLMGSFEPAVLSDRAGEANDSEAEFLKQRKMLEAILRQGCYRPFSRNIRPSSSSVVNTEDINSGSYEQNTTEIWKGHSYLQTRLPDAAIVQLPLSAFQNSVASLQHTTKGSEKDNDQNLNMWDVCRLAGGVEPYVNFAVGTPLEGCNGNGNRVHKEGQPIIKEGNISPFAFITCLLRIDTQVKRAGAVTPTEERRLPLSGQNAGGVGKSPSERQPSMAEPWRLGIALDPDVPVIVRTVSESGAPPTQPNTVGDAAAHEPTFLGRIDAETYLIPQRELLIQLFVPPRTQSLCLAHNQDRVQRQIRMGHASTPSALEMDRVGGYAAVGSSTNRAREPAWIADSRLTYGRLVHGRYHNANAAMEAAGLAASSDPTERRGLGGNSKAVDRKLTKASGAHLRLTCHEVRALPGDVLFIPRGWAYTVKRIIGSALLDKSHRDNADLQSGTVPRAKTIYSNKFHNVMPSSEWTRGVAASQKKDPSASTVVDASSEGEKNGDIVRNGTTEGENPLTVSSVELDAFCLLYKPYPELSAMQAHVYVPANYTHRGVEEFYDKGGNPTYYKYE